MSIWKQAIFSLVLLVAAVIVWDLETGKYQNIVSVAKDAVAKNTEARPIAVYWKSEDRILFRLSVRPRDGVSIDVFKETGPGLGRPEDVANVVLFLASDESKYLNGAELLLDNALTIQ